MHRDCDVQDFFIDDFDKVHVAAFGALHQKAFLEKSLDDFFSETTGSFIKSPLVTLAAALPQW